MKIKAGIIGATGYTGSELVRLLYFHPDVSIEVITSETHRGKAFSDIHSHFTDLVDQPLVSVEELDKYDLDIAFLALPHGVSMSYVERFEGADFRIIDLSGDFRLADPQTYESWYQKEHTYPQGFSQAVYGLPELYRDQIREASLAANPGCYPTSAILGAAPLLDAGLVDPEKIIIDSKSGVTGAGVKAKPTTHYSNVSDNFKAYGLKAHRHTIEIEENLSGLGPAGVTVQFTPHLLPVDRGILSTIYTQPLERTTGEQVWEAYREYYRDEPFVRLRREPPSLKDVRGSNFCDLFATYDERTGRVITLSVIDNLVKGAAGQAMQNMNLMCGIEETTGFLTVPLNP